jgi:hypothetical protein
MPFSREVLTGSLDVSRGTNVTSRAVFESSYATRARFRAAKQGFHSPLDRFNPSFAGVSLATPFSNQDHITSPNYAVPNS